MLVGQQIGPYLIEKELGSGAMGTVYRGRHIQAGKVVAVKVMAPGLGTTNSNAVDRFKHEVLILSQLKHDNIVRIYASGKWHGTRFFAMEYVEGEPLDQILARRGRINWEEVVDLGQQVCSALQHAHLKGIIHRDLKPSNLMVLPNGSLKLMDFGIAKDFDLTALTSANCTVGTASYMSPEQCRGERNLTNKSDLYSLGIVFYELLTGRKPFSADNAMEMFLQHVQGTFARPSKFVPDLPVGLDNLVCALLEKKPEDRPFDAQLVANILGTIREKVAAGQSAALEEARKRRGDQSGTAAKPDEADKRVARYLLRGRVRGRRNKTKASRRQIQIRAAGLALLLLGCIATLFLFLHRSPAGSAPTANLAVVADKERIEDEDLLRRYRKHRHGALKVQSQSDDQKSAFLAVEDEDDGKLDRATQKWQQLARDGTPRWQRVAAEHIEAIKTAASNQDKLLARYKEMRESDKELPSLTSAREQKAFYALRCQLFGDLPRASARFKEFKDELNERLLKDDAVPNAEDYAWLLFASQKIRELAGSAGYDAPPVEWLKTKLDAIETKFKRGGSLLDARMAYRDFIGLYSAETDPAIKALVEEAKARLDPLQRQP